MGGYGGSFQISPRFLKMERFKMGLYWVGTLIWLVGFGGVR
jgi:hypothetical protein